MPGRVIGRAKFGALLASSSVAALLLGGGMPSAYAACNTTYTNTTSAGCTNSVAITGIAINNSTITSAISNSGTISSNGIVLSHGSTITGAIVDTGTISGGITIDRTSKINASNTGIVINAPTFAGGISNSGTISTAHTHGISLANVSTFAGGISNSGTISAGPTGAGIVLSSVSNFTGGISNSGTISGFDGLFFGLVSTFAGGISNSGTIATKKSGIIVASVSIFAGGISNSGAIATSPTGNGIELSSVSTFTGGITNSGTVSAGFGGIFINGGSTFLGGISNSGTISAGGDGIHVLNVSSFSGEIANSGKITGGSIGMLIRGVSLFSGGISNSGTIAGSAGIDLLFISTFTGGITNSGTISESGVFGLDIAGVSTFAGNISNAGTITAPTGIMITNNTTFAAGSAVINTGTITAAQTGIRISAGVFVGGGSIVNTGTISGGVIGINDTAATSPVNVFDSGTIIGTGGTAVNISGAAVGSSFTLGPGYNITGKVLGQNGDAFQLGGTGSGTFNLSLLIDTIAGGCGGGGVCPQYEGFNIFNVVSGTWTTTGTFSGTETWNVNGGTLAGTGTFAGINVNSGGTLEPGTPGTPGTFMTVGGNLAFASGAAYLVNLNSTAASRANVAGAVTLNGAVQGFLAPGSYSNKTTYDILDPSSISGTFTGFTAVNAPGFGGTLTYQPNDVMLNLTAQLGSGGGLNANQQHVATTINTYFNNGGALPASFFNVFGLSGPALGSALSQLSGEPATDAGKGANQLMNDFLNLMLDPTASGGGGVSGGGANGFAPEQDTSLPADIALAYAKALKAPQPQAPQNFDQRWTAWGAGFGGTSFTDGNATIGSNNVKASDFGFAAGMEYHLTPDTVYGFALAGGGTNWNLAQALGSGRSDAFQAGVYAKTHWGPLYLSGALAFANHWFTTNRIAMGDQLQATFTGQSYAARGEVGYRYAVPITGAIVGVTPYAALQAQDFHTPSYSETDLNGGGFALSYNSQNATDTRSELGARFDNLQVVDGMPLILRGRLAWAHDWFTNATALNAAFQTLPGSNFTVNGAAPPKNSALTTAAAELHITSNWTAIAKFDGEFGSGAQTYGGTGTLRYSW